MENHNETIYIEELVKIIKPLKARVFNEDYETIQSYDKSGNKIVLLLAKGQGGGR